MRLGGFIGDKGGVLLYKKTRSSVALQNAPDSPPNISRHANPFFWRGGESLQ